jgi:CrcB protein
VDALSKTLIIALGGAFGANARYWLGGAIQSRLGTTFPWQTMAINVLGSLVIGVFMEMSLREAWDPRWRLFIAIGILGGFTTYSTFAYESVNLLSDRSYDWGMFYILGTPILCVISAWVGRAIARAICSI